MEITAIIEKGADGYYSVRSEDHINNQYFGGFGANAREAKEDFTDSVFEILDEIDNKEPVKIIFKYDLPSFFSQFNYINVSKFAEYTGINESKMRQYKSGVAFPGEKTTKKILTAIHSIGAELSDVTL